MADKIDTVSSDKWTSNFVPPLIAICALFTSLNVRGYDESFILMMLVLFLLVVLLVVPLFKRYQHAISLPKHAIVYWWFAFLGWCALSLLWTQVKGISFLTWITFCTAPLSLLLGFGASDRQWQWFCRLLLCLGVIVIGMTSYQAFVLNIARPSGFLRNWNTNSAFIGAILLPYCAVYLWQITQNKTNVWLGVFIFAAAFGMSLGQGRATFAALMLGLVALSLAFRKQNRAGKAVGWTLALVAGGFVLGDLLHGGMFGQRLLDAGTVITSSGASVDSLGSGREHLWAAAWKMYLDRPWMGWGLGMYHWLYPQYRSSGYAEDAFFVHNDYLQFLLELGPLGLLFCLGGAWSLFLLSWRLWMSDAVASERRFIGLGLGLACGVMLLHSVVDFNLYHTPMLMLLGGYAGRLCHLVSQCDTGSIKAWKPAGSLTGGGYYGILAGVFLLVSIGLLNIAMGFYTTRSLIRNNDPIEIFTMLTKAEQFLPFVEQYETQKAILIFNLVKQPPADALAEDRKLLIDFGLQQLDQSIQRNPLSPKGHFYKAELLKLIPDQQKAIVQHLQEALRIDPYFLEARVKLAEILDEIGDSQHAARILAEGLGKVYLINSPSIVVTFWQAVEEKLSLSANGPSLRQIVRKQIQDFTASPVFKAGKRVHMTLPDIGWNPSK